MIGRRSRKVGPSGDEDPTTPLQQPMPPSAEHTEVSSVTSAAATTATLAPDVSGVSEIVGTTVISQISVGAPSPSVEPKTIAGAYRSLPFRPDVVIDGWSTDAMTVRGASLRGHLHRYNGAPRQDDFAVHDLPGGRVIVLVADGVSGASQSHIGASTVVMQAGLWLHSNLGDNIGDTDWSGLLKAAAWALTERAQTLFGLDEPDPVRAEEELATTLVCAVIEPTGPQSLRAYLVGAGDSVAWVLSNGQFIEILTGKTVSGTGVASSAVVGLPRLPAEITPMVVDFSGNDVLLIATDGIGDPLGSGQGGVGNLFRDLLARQPAPSLIEFAHAVDFSRETFDDDRTLVAVWPRSEVPQNAAARHRKPSSIEGLR
jgi:serine/threonine protein phosphatase PrpC